MSRLDIKPLVWRHDETSSAKGLSNGASRLIKEKVGCRSKEHPAGKYQRLQKTKPDDHNPIFHGRWVTEKKLSNKRADIEYS